MQKKESHEVEIEGIRVWIPGVIVGEIVRKQQKLRCILYRVVDEPLRYAVGIQKVGDLLPSLFVNPNVDDDKEMGRSLTGVRMKRKDVVEFFPDLALECGIEKVK